MVRRLRTSFQNFFMLESAGGIILLITTAMALIWANSTAGETYDAFWHMPVGFEIGPFGISMSLLHWINDGLMAVFFFVVGLEIKREVISGELSSPRKAMLPIAAAIGGMIIPAIIYTMFNKGTEGVHGWGIPMATDIAFAIGILALLGKRIPLSIKIFLTALAIVDDLGAVIVIAIFYTSNISMTALGIAALFFAIMVIMGIKDIRNPFFYLVVGTLLWFAMLKSGVHATIAGVLGALTIPSNPRIDSRDFTARCDEILSNLKENIKVSAMDASGELKQMVFHGLETSCKDFISPLQRLEHLLHPWVSYMIMPVFALANAGVSLEKLSLESLTNPVSLGIIFGLVIGKQTGVTIFSWLAVKTGFAHLPNGTGWKHIYGAGWLAGIGFTMSLFIGSLAFKNADMLTNAKIGILTASFISAVIGLCLLYIWTDNPNSADKNADA